MFFKPVFSPFFWVLFLFCNACFSPFLAGVQLFCIWCPEKRQKSASYLKSFCFSRVRKYRYVSIANLDEFLTARSWISHVVGLDFLLWYFVGIGMIFPAVINLCHSVHGWAKRRSHNSKKTCAVRDRYSALTVVFFSILTAVLLQHFLPLWKIVWSHYSVVWTNHLPN